LFIYDVWTPSSGASNGHLTLPNGTNVDTFCSAMLVLPTANADTVLAGGDVWDGTQISQHGNPNSVLFNRSNNTLTRAADMNRAPGRHSIIARVCNSLTAPSWSPGRVMLSCQASPLRP